MPIAWADWNPQVRVEPSPTPPLLLREAWNELIEGSYIPPTVGDGTSFGDALAAMLSTAPARGRSVLTLSESGVSIHTVSPRASGATPLAKRNSVR